MRVSEKLVTPEPKPEYDSTMPKFKFIGKQPENLARYGQVSPGEVIEVSDELAKGLLTYGGGQYEPVKEALVKEPSEEPEQSGKKR